MKIASGLSRLVMEHRNSALFLGALMSGGVALYAGQQYVAQRLESERARLAPVDEATVDLIVAKHDLAKGEILRPEVLAVRSIPRSYAMSDALRPEQLETMEGARLLGSVRAGEPVLGAMVMGADTTTFSQKLRAGVRALTIPVDEINAFSGMLQPGDRIDLYFSAVSPRANGALESTAPLFQNLLVLATGQQLHAGIDETQERRGFSTVTIEATPEQVQRLVVARQAGRLTASLRHPDDSATLASHSMDLRQLFGVVDTPPKRARAVTWPQMIVGGLGGPPTVGRLQEAEQATPRATASGTAQGGGVQHGGASGDPMPADTARAGSMVDEAMSVAGATAQPRQTATPPSSRDTGFGGATPR